MNQKEFRQIYHGEVQDWGAEEFPALPIYYQNGPDPDLDQVGRMWLDVSTRYTSGRALTLGSGAGPLGRLRGSLVLTCWHRAGEGMADIDDILVSLTDRLRNRHLGTATVLMPTPQVPAPAVLGWYREGLMFPFWYDG